MPKTTTRRRRSGLTTREMPDYPRLDAPRQGADSDTLAFFVTARQAAKGLRNDARQCAIALAAKAAHHDAWVNREVVYVLRPATRALIAWNRKEARRAGQTTWRTDGVKVGDLVLWRYVLRERHQDNVAAFDDTEADFVPGYNGFRPPSPGHSLYRDKEGGRTTRRQRKDAHRDGKPSGYQRTITKVALRSGEIDLVEATPVPPTPRKNWGRYSGTRQDLGLSN